MKNMKKFAAMIAALTLSACSIAPMVSSAVTATEGGNTITITNADAKDLIHTDMSAYQVFTGTYDADKEELSVSGWGDGVDVVELIKALKADKTFGEDDANAFANIDEANSAITAQKVSDIVGGWTDDSDEAIAFAKLAVAKKSSTTSGNFSKDGTSTTIANLPDGYYVIVDNAAATKGDEGSAYTLGLLAVAGGESVTANPKTDFPTVVKKVLEDDNTTNDGFGAGYNDVADWDINTPVPFKIIGTVPSNIDKYDHYYMEFSDRMDNSFDVYQDLVVTVDDTELTKDTHYTVEPGEDDNDFKVVITDLKGLGITITNATKVTVTYSAKIKVDNAVIGLDGQENFVDLTYSNNPNNTGDGTNKPEDTGKTPEDKVIVFTYEVDINKIDGNTKANIPNAKFKLSNGKTGEDEKWAKVVGNKFDSWVAKDDATELITDSDGMIKVIGLDDGSYKLEELNWSTEYNIPTTPFAVVLDATTEFTQNSYETADSVLTGITGTVGTKTADVITPAKLDGIKGQIENNKGTQLPSTGGIGTTIFYLGGGAMVAVAGVFLITKKRMGRSEN